MEHTKTIYCIRHGESQENVEERFYGEHASLTERGIRQAKSVAERLKNLEVEVVLSSHYKRARKTGEIIANALNLDLIEVPDAHEYAYLTKEHFGISRHDSTFLEIHMQTYGAWKNGTSDFYPGSETYEEFLSRVESAMRFIESLPYKKIAFVNHSMFLKLMLAKVLCGDTLNSKIAFSIRESVKLHNTGITIYSVKEGSWKLIRFNDAEHL